jgi:hypothetical protein
LIHFTKGLEAAGHTSEVVDLYTIRFTPVFRTQDFTRYVHESMPPLGTFSENIRVSVHSNAIFR